MPTYPYPVAPNNPAELLSYYSLKFIDKLLQFIAAFIVALVLVILGYFIAKLIEWLVKWGVEKLRINEALKTLGFERWLEKANIELKTENFLGALAFYVVWVLFWMPAFDILGLSNVNEFIYRAINYLPVALVGGLIFVISVFLAEFLRKLSFVWFKGLELKGAKLASEIVFYAVAIFGLIAALNHLGVARDILNIVVGGVILAFALGVGLSLGLGGQDLAREFLNKIKEKIE